VAPPITPSLLATSVLSLARKCHRVIVANIRGRALVRSRASGSIHVITGSL
jgi:hypothetical protein